MQYIKRMSTDQIIQQIKRADKYMEYITDMREMSKIRDELDQLRDELKFRKYFFKTK